MAKQGIDIGVEGNDGTGDSIRESFRKVNENFQELYAVFGAGGQISFTNLGDTPNTLDPRKILLVNDAGTALEYQELASDAAKGNGDADSISISYDVAGKVILSTAFRALAQDLSPSLGEPLDAGQRAIANVGITQTAVDRLNAVHPGNDYTIDDVVITKGYADARYIAGVLPIRVEDEPVDASEYILTVESYTGGNISVIDHGFDNTINGTPYNFKAEDTDPSTVISGTTYYLRFQTSSQLSVHRSKQGAFDDNDQAYITHIIDPNDVHTFTDAGYDENLEGFFLANEAMPRKSVVRRQGDAMTGPLVLHDSPGELAGLTTSEEDLQAATKFYVDNTSYSSPQNLFVSTTGDDKMRGVPSGKDGTSWSYAYRSINAAARRAEEMIKASSAEPGPYMQTITRDNQSANAEVVSLGVNNPLFNQARNLIEENREWFIREITAYLAFKYPTFEYNIGLCERDLGLILDAIAIDINRSPSLTEATANSLTRRAAESYYASASGRIAIGRQLTETVDAIQTARDYTEQVLLNRRYNQSAVGSITNASISTLTTITDHGLVDKNIIVVESVSGMTEVNDQFYYVKVTGARTLELFVDAELTTPLDSTLFTPYAGQGNIGLVYQTDEKQVFDIGDDAEAVARQAVTDKFNLVINILSNGIDEGASVAYGRTYRVVVANGGLGATDQGNIENRDVLPGKVLVGKISGAQGRIVTYTQNDPTQGGNDNIEIHLLKPIDFIEGEDLEYGNFVSTEQVTIFVESGQYEEDYPIKIAANVSLKGDEFRRVIIRPKNRVSQSSYANTYTYRDKYFDGLDITTGGARFYNQTGDWQGYFGYHYLTNPEVPLDTGIAVTNAGEYVKAANIIAENREFIQEEIIQYINQNTAALLYDHTQFGDDLIEILTGIGYDIALDSTYNARYLGLKFQRDKTIYKDAQLKSLWVVGLTEAKRLVNGLPAITSSSDATARSTAAFDEIIDIIQNGVMDTDTASSLPVYNTVNTTDPLRENAKNKLVDNYDFIAQEALAFLQLNNPRKYFNEEVRLRDARCLAYALAYDVMYNSNTAIVEYTKDMFIGDRLRLEIVTRQATVEMLAHLKTVVSNIVQNIAVTPTVGNAIAQDIGGTPATATEGTEVSNLIEILRDSVNNNNLLNLASETFPNLIGLDSALIAANSGIAGATTTIRDGSIGVIDASPEAVFTYNIAKCKRDTGLIADAMGKDLLVGGDEQSLQVQGEYYDSYIVKYNNGGFGGQENVTKGAILHTATIVNRLLQGSYNPADILQNTSNSSYVAPDFKYGIGEVGTGNIVNNLVDRMVYAFDRRFNPPKRNDEMDVFLMNDASILRNMTVQGHGGFLCVLDPAGQILTKSPYVQTGSSFSKSINAQIFAGGMFVDAYVGNLPMSVPTTIDVGNGPESGKINNFALWVRSEEGQGLFIREPELPCPFYLEGRRFQVNAISDYDQSQGWCKIYLDATSNNNAGFDESLFEDRPGDIARDLYLQTAGNRSMLGNDFTQINDLGYALVTTNGAFSEMVSMFTYYCHAAYYAANGSEIRSLNGSNGYGNFGLVAEGADPNEIPDQVTVSRDTVQTVKAFTNSPSGQTNSLADTSLTVYDFREAPLKNSFIYIVHPTQGALNYKITNVQNLSTPGNDGVSGFGGAPVATGINTLDATIGGGNGFTGTAPGGSGIYRNVLQKSASGTGTGARFDITLVAGNPTITLANSGSLFATNDDVVISGADIGGTTPANDISVKVALVYQTTAGTFSNDIYRLTIQEGSSNEDLFPDLQETLAHNDLIEYRHGETLIFDGVASQNITERPSTAVNFDESDLITYRSTGFTTKDDQNLDLSSTEIKAVFDTDFKYVILELDPTARATNASLVGGTGQLGQNTTDTYLSVKKCANVSDGLRIVQDATDANSQTIKNPGDAGYTGGMIFTYGSRTLQVLEYGAVSTGPLTTISINGGTGKITITSSNHGLVNGDLVDLLDVEGTIQLDGVQKYVGEVTSNQYVLYDDEAITTFTDGSTYTAHVGGTGTWIKADSVYYIKTQAIGASDVTGDTANNIGTTNSTTRDITLGIINGTTAEITIAISLLRATGHDFTEIGTGGFNTSNYPNVLLGEPIGGTLSKAGYYTDEDNASSSQVWERRKGRVFFITSDNDGFFRVGKYFVVDQSTGSITFAGEVGISRAASLGFKEGVTIDEFSNDELFTDLSDTAVPTEKAIANYVSRRLGHNGSAQLTGANRIAPGFVALNGSTAMEAPLDMSSNKITNLLDPTDANDATTKDYVQQAVAAYDEITDLRNYTDHTVSPANLTKQLVVPSGVRKIVLEPEASTLFDPTSSNKSLTGAGGATGTLVARETRFDKVLNQNVVILTYTPGPTDFGAIGSVQQTSPSVSSAILEAPIDEIVNAVESTASDINLTVTRGASNTEFDLQIEAQAILNADVNDAAAIDQSKLNMTAATTRANATNITQADLGLASFDGDDFSVTDGWVTLKANEVDFADLPSIATDTVIGRSATGAGNTSAVAFSTVVDEGGGLEDGDFTTALVYGNPVNDPGQALIKTGAGAYSVSEIAYNNENTSIAKRDSSGNLQATAFIIGGTSTSVVLSEPTSNKLRITTPEGGLILDATGSSKPAIDTGGAINVGDIPSIVESQFHKDSPYGTVGGVAGSTTETSSLASRWIYTSFIEAANELGSGSTGIGLGTNTGFGAGGADIVTFVTGGNVTGKVTTNGFVGNLAGNVTGNLTGDVTGNVSGNAGSVTNGVYTTGNQSIAGLKTFTGGVTIEATDTLTVRTISTGAAATTGTITGRWSLSASSRFEATYADLAEYYEGDVEYEVGTVLVFGGDKEVTQSTEHRSTRVAGVVSDQSAYTMNQACPGIKTLTALQGKVPVNVIGTVAKGDMLVASAIPGYAVVDNDPKVGSVIGKAIDTKDDTERGSVHAVVGRV